MDIGVVIATGTTMGFFAWMFAQSWFWTTHICGWAMGVIEDKPSGTHRNLFERLLMEKLGFSWCPENKKWLAPDRVMFVLSDGHRLNYRESVFEGKYLLTTSWWSFMLLPLGVVGSFAVLLWKLTLPIILFIAAVYLLRYLRRKAKEKAMKVLEEGSAEQDKETSSKDLA